ncbi:MAG: hypothetical protein JKX73_05575 [Flavobacteriales bacterium]|nr:hypothetical protein [Flavobacteriales bacterium]
MNRTALNFLTFLVVAACLVASTNVLAQNVAINTDGSPPNASSALDINFTAKGLLIPRVTYCQRVTPSCANGMLDAGGLLPAAAQGLLVYQTDGSGNGEGFYYNTSGTTTPAWTKIFGGAGGGIYAGSGSLTSDPTTVTMGTNNLAFTSSVVDGFSVDGTTFSVDAANNWIGIGTTAPKNILHIVDVTAPTITYNSVFIDNKATSSTASITKRGLRIASTGTWNGAGAINEGLSVSVSGGTTNYAAIFSGGFVGIETSSPQQGLHVADDVIIGGGQGANYDGPTEHIKIWAQSKVWNLGVVNNAAAASSDFFISQTDGVADGTFHIEPTGHVGIGTAAPESFAKLHVEIDDTDDALYVKNTNATSNTNAVFRVDVTSAASNGFRVQRDGNVGIGTASPDRLLEVSGSGSRYARITSTTPNNAGLELLRVGAGSYDWRIVDIGGDLRFQSSGDDLSTVSDIMTIEFDGNVGIGTTDPSAVAHFFSSSRGDFKLLTTSGVGHDLGYDGGVDDLFVFAHFGDESTGKTTFSWDDGIGARDILTLENTGEVGIGTTIPNSALHINAASGTGLRVQIVGNTKLIVNSNGGVAVGGNNTPPINGLDVADQIKIRGGTPAVGEVLTSDAVGLATWETPGEDQMILSAKLTYSEDDISGWTTLSGDDIEVDVALGFSVTLGGIAYSNVRLSCNGWIEFNGASTAVGNSCLPTASFSNPTICWFWDDLVTEGTNIRYITLGTSPNRVFFVDFKVFLWNVSTQEIEGTVQIHEGSGLMNVSYKESLTTECRGQTATIGFQMAGGASAKVYPIGCNAAVLDDNLAQESGWSICPVR